MYGDAIPENGHPPRDPWGGQRAAAARVVSHLAGKNQKYKEEWDRYADNLTDQKGQCPFRHSFHILLVFLTRLEGTALARGTITHLAALPRETAASSPGGDESPAASWLNRTTSSKESPAAEHRVKAQGASPTRTVAPPPQPAEADGTSAPQTEGQTPPGQCTGEGDVEGVDWGEEGWPVPD